MSNSGPRIVVVTAPSGSGKSSVAAHLLAAFPSMRFSVSATTRPARGSETDGVEYHFHSEEAFRGLIAQDALIEYEEVYPGRFYGTLRSEADRATTAAPLLLDIDVQGAVRVKALFGPDAFVVFIRPPSYEVLEARLRGRGTDAEAELETRLARVRHELGFEGRFDAVVINDDLSRAAAETIGLVRAFLNGSKG